ncbi:MAG TPA: (bacterio)chlorophyll synthase [Chloroflexia bacterium]|nr:(bacterio)chlorophyll synthase [Chloroflexia bacterium]
MSENESSVPFNSGVPVTGGQSAHSTATVDYAALAPAARSTWRGHLDLLDPVTWTAGPQAFICGALASGGLAWDGRTLGLLLLGIALSGPLTIGFSQSINDFFDRDVDAVNEPTRPIPAGLVTPRGAVLNFSVVGLLALAVAVLLALLIGSPNGEWLVGMTVVGLALGVAYSAPPLAFKRNGLWGPLSVGLGYNLLTWLFGNLVFAPLKTEVVVLALVNAAIAAGLLILNDLKSVEGDRALGLRTAPVLYGVHGALLIAFTFINLSQLALMLFLFAGGHFWLGGLQLLALLAQISAQPALYKTPTHNQYKRYLLTGNGLILLVALFSALAFGGYVPFNGW